MPYYTTLSQLDKKHQKRIAGNLLGLRERLRAEIPERTIQDTLLLATWNIRNFGRQLSSDMRRLPESYFYIAEILSAFDLVAVQEVDRNLAGMGRLMEILGPDWEYFAADPTGGLVGNQRLVFMYDRRKVQFQNVAGQIVLPDDHLIQGRYQFARSPYLVALKSGWFDFTLCAVHIYFGGIGGEHIERRVAEIDTLGRIMARRAERENLNIVLMGDFNILSPEHVTMQALTQHGFLVPKELVTPSNTLGTRFYSQIAFMVRPNQFQLGNSRPPAGAFDFFKTVFRDQDYDLYYQLVEDKKNWDRRGSTESKQLYYQRMWRTGQMSDHLPLWIELQIDFSDEYLQGLKTSKQP
ncbi:MAG TPA: endonuclease/exonuclease/phosphatase family protein [Anaerolineales bacterium]|nr:endonuclease/exonuclease/phosphatase family protein [Anaerolineales bacterium]